MANKMKLALVSVREDLAKVMGTPEGRRVMMRLIYGNARVLTPTFNESALRTAYLEGVRSVGLGLLAELETITPELTHVAQVERLKVDAIDGIEAKKERQEREEPTED